MKEFVKSFFKKNVKIYPVRKFLRPAEPCCSVIAFAGMKFTVSLMGVFCPIASGENL